MFMSKDSTGILYVVATPIGNLDDLSARAKKILNKVDLVAAEDTRRTLGLLSSIDIKNRLISYHKHNESKQTPVLLEKLKRGESIALVSDAGSPLLSDPGSILIKAARSSKVSIVSVPGPSAITSALSIVGLPADQFVFEGFLPRGVAAKADRLAQLAADPRTIVIFESVHRLVITMKAIKRYFGPSRHMFIARELTKVHESIYEGTTESLYGQLDNNIPLKGEFVLLISGNEELNTIGDDELIRVFGLLIGQMSPKAAVTLTAKITGASRNRVYAVTRSIPGNSISSGNL